MKVAVVGARVSGLVAAYLLHREHDITIFDAGGYAGGHVNTIPVEVESKRLPGRGETVVFSAAMFLRRRAFSGRRLLALLVRHPFITHRVSAAIYTRALRLWRKKVAYIPHTAIGKVPQ